MRHQKQTAISPIFGIVALLITVALYIGVNERNVISSFISTTASRVKSFSVSKFARPPLLPSSEPVLNGLKYKNGMKRDETILFKQNDKPWKTYKNYLYGFEVSAPENWNIVDMSRTSNGKQQPRVSINSPLRFDLPGVTLHGAYFNLNLDIRPQNEDARKIVPSEVDGQEFDKAYELRDQAVNIVDLKEDQLKATDEYKTAQEVISTARYLYSLDDSKSFVQSIPKPDPVLVKPATHVPFNTWRTYKDKQNGFSLQYPPSWSIFQTGGPDGFDKGKDGLYPKFLKSFEVLIVPDYWHDSSIMVYKSSYTPQHFFENYYSGIQGIVNEKTYQVNGDSVLYFEYPDSYDENNIEHRYFLSHKGLMFEFLMGNMSKGITNDEAQLTIDLTSAFPDFEKMVNSITFQN